MFVSDQSHWNSDYAAAYIRLSLLGVNNINDLMECTATLPDARPDVPEVKKEAKEKKRPYQDD